MRATNTFGAVSQAMFGMEVALQRACCMLVYSSGKPRKSHLRLPSRACMTPNEIEAAFLQDSCTNAQLLLTTTTAPYFRQ